MCVRSCDRDYFPAAVPSLRGRGKGELVIAKEDWRQSGMPPTAEPEIEEVDLEVVGAYGLSAWDPGMTAFARWPERNDQPGTVSRHAHATLHELGHRYDGRFLGEFEVFPLSGMDQDGVALADGWHQFWLPVVPPSRGSPEGGRCRGSARTTGDGPDGI